MFSRKARGLVMTSIALIAAAGLLVGCSDDGTGPSAGTGSTGGSGDGSVPDVITTYPSDTWDVTITSVAADKAAMRPMQEWYMDEIERRTNGAVQFHRTTANEICAQSDQYSCIQSGAAGLLVQVPNYQPTVFTPATLPEITFAGDNAAAMTAAIQEEYETNADVRAFYDAKGLVPVATWSVGRLLIGSTVPVDSVADLDGLTMRVAGTIAAPDFAAAGIVPTQVTADEAYNSFSTGLVKSAAGSLDFFYAWKLAEVLPYLTDPGLGVYSEFAMYWSKAQWDAFPSDIQALLEDINSKAISEGTWVQLWHDGYDTNPMDASAPTHYIGTTEECQLVLSSPSIKSISEWGDDEVAEFKALGAASQGGHTTNEALWVKNATDSGLAGAQGILDEYKSLYEKYAAQFTDETYTVDPLTTCIASFKG